MSNVKIVIFAARLCRHSCFLQNLQEEFDTTIAHNESEFVSKIRREEACAGVVCFCSAIEKDAEMVVRLDAVAGLVPVLSCSKTSSAEFVRAAMRNGFDRFLDCNMDKERISALVHKAIRRGCLRRFLESSSQTDFPSSPKVHRIIQEITHRFPHWPTEKELAEKLEISQRWLQKLCREAFGVTYSRLKRRICVHQALRMMKHSALENTEIAIQLNYSEESNLARDFRKELGYSPSEARRKLTVRSPEELLIAAALQSV